MFDNYYPFKYKFFQKIISNELTFIEHKLIFYGKFNYKYIVTVEEYEHSTFAIKFHLKNHCESKHKYSLLTGFGDADKILFTCIKIMVYFFRKNPLASFAFVGAQLLTEETAKNTKRFLLYRRVVASFFGPVQFLHYLYEKNSYYMLLNRDNNETDLKQKIELMFSTYYIVEF